MVPGQQQHWAVLNMLVLATPPPPQAHTPAPTWSWFLGSSSSSCGAPSSLPHNMCTHTPAPTWSWLPGSSSKGVSRQEAISWWMVLRGITGRSPRRSQKSPVKCGHDRGQSVTCEVVQLCTHSILCGRVVHLQKQASLSAAHKIQTT
jgi:hypothetical protein